MKYVSEIIFISAIGVIVALSHGENHEFWKKLSEILIIVLIFTISSLWATRTSAFYSFAQERNNFYHYIIDNEKEYKIINKVNLKRIIEDPASQYLGSARSSRGHAIIYNMTIFYLLLSLLFLFIVLLLNLKISYKDPSLIKLLYFQIFNCHTLYPILIIVVIAGIVISYLLSRRYKKCPEEIIFFVVLLLSGSLTIFIEKDLRCYYFNILFFSIASYLLYLSYKVFGYTYTGQDPFNRLIIWTYDYMDKIFPFLGKKKEAQINPDVKKKKEMLNLWKLSLVLNLKEIFKHIQYDGDLRETWRHNEEYVENLINALTASEWNDPSILYLYAISIRLISFLKINNCYKTVIKKSRYEHAEEAAKKRWGDLRRKLWELEYNERNYSGEEREEFACRERRVISDYTRAIYVGEIHFLRNIITILENLPNNIEAERNRLDCICNKLIEIYENRTKN